jgi:H+/Cl- antiporter ClcA
MLVLGIGGLLIFALIFLLGLALALVELLFGVNPSAISHLHDMLLIVAPLLGALVGCAVYYGACQAAVHGSRLVIEAWSRRP